MQPKPTMLAHHFDTLEQQHEAATLGMWTFLATEVLIFGAMFTAYAVYRYLYPHEFEEASGKLNVLIGAVNTVVLLTSSLTMALAVHTARMGNTRLLVTWLALTALLGTAFMGFKALEYYEDYRENLVPGLAFEPHEWTDVNPNLNPRRVELFYMFYYVLTGLHAVHLTVGIGLALWILVQANQGMFSPEYYSPVEVFGLYWHLVDIVWIFLLPLLYLAGTRSLADLHF